MSYQLTIAHKPGTIECDFKWLNAYVESQIQKYDGLVVTKEQIKDAEKNMADLNKMKDLIEDRRKEIKKEITIPYTEFEKNIKPIVKRIDEVRGKIKEQVDAFKEQEKAEKKKQIAAYWDEIKIHDIPLEQIFDERWLNTTFSEKEWKAALNQRKERITADLASFANYADAKMCKFMITEYMKTLDVQTCLDRWNEQIEAERRAEEAKARAEAIRQDREEETRRRAEMAAQRAAEEVRPAPQEDPAPEQDPRDFLYSPTFKLEALNHEQAHALISYFKDHDLEYLFFEPMFKMDSLTYDEAMDLTNYFKKNGLKFMSISKEKRRK